MNCSPDVYQISSTLQKDVKDTRDYIRRITCYENDRYYSETKWHWCIHGTKMSNSNEGRRNKHFFASDLMKTIKGV